MNARARRQEGVTVLEYIVLGAVLVLGLVAGINYFKGKATEGLQTEGDQLSNVASGNVAATATQYAPGK